MKVIKDSLKSYEIEKNMTEMRECQDNMLEHLKKQNDEANLRGTGL